MQFKEFILNEAQTYLAQKVGDILSAAQELNNDAKHMGTRDLTRFSERIVSQIRRILHSTWPREEKKHLKTLQKIAVAIMKSVDEHDDLPGTITNATASLERLVADLGMPINKLATSDENEAETSDDTGVSKAVKKQPKPPQNLDSGAPVAPAGVPGQDLTAQPLGGTSGPLDAF